ncbi:caspase family protein [Sediminitomix flava]|uniref:WD40 repeat protein n=1 Tax=Sediminitomix flava TaxID=379075 RepID=A0A315Z769_SEDFL|nr:caspase family protein [Sediminitomix flava]PWJ39255.1 WD40 repeat protein [Sediminitomix flava]
MHKIISSLLGISLFFSAHFSFAQVWNSSSYDITPAISADGKTLVFQSYRDGWSYFYESRKDSAWQWSEPKRLKFLDGIATEMDEIYTPSLSADGRQLFFSAWLFDESESADLYVAERTEDQKWVRPRQIKNKTINTELYEKSPSLSADGMDLYFVRFKPVRGGKPKYSIWTARKNEDGSWGDAQKLPAHINNGSASEPKIHYNGKSLFFLLENKEGSQWMVSQRLKDGSWEEATPVNFISENVRSWSMSEFAGTIFKEKEIDGKRNISIALLPENDMLFLSPKALVEDYVTEKMRAWQQRGKFEPSSAYRKRVNSASILEQTEYYVREIAQKIANARINWSKVNNEYDPDRQVFQITYEGFQPFYVKVPLDKAETFDKEFKNIQCKTPIFTFGTEKPAFVSADLQLPSFDDTFSYRQGDVIQFESALAMNEQSRFELKDYHRSSSVKSKIKPEVEEESFDFGDDFDIMAPPPRKDYALVIATDEYDQWNNLVNPVNDAETISKELEENYGFEVNFVKNPTTAQIMSALRKFASKKYNFYDQLFIFIAGHGQYDPIFQEGYIVGKNSLIHDEGKTTYVSHSSLRTVINNIPCEHIFLAIDACFGGTFDPTIASSRGNLYDEISKQDFVDRKLQFKTRRYLTSGGKEYVPDGRPGHHSPFARKFLEALRNYGGDDRILTMGELLNYTERLEPQPRTGEFGDNAPGSDFIFISK